MPRPTISVIVPVYNGERHLAEAVVSIRAQKYQPLEVIVVDDGSTDGTADLARNLGPGIRCLHQPNAGPAAARNQGLGASTGDWITFLDADDLWPPGRLDRQQAFLDTHPDIDVVQGLCQPFRTSGPETGGDLGVCWSPKPDSALFRRGVFDRVGGFDPNLRVGEDLDWFYRARERGVRIAVQREVAVLYRLRGDSLTGGGSPDTVSAAALAAARASLRRRRPAGGGRVAPLTPVRLEREDRA